MRSKQDWTMKEDKMADVVWIVARRRKRISILRAGFRYRNTSGWIVFIPRIRCRMFWRRKWQSGWLMARMCVDQCNEWFGTKNLREWIFGNESAVMRCSPAPNRRGQDEDEGNKIKAFYSTICVFIYHLSSEQSHPSHLSLTHDFTSRSIFYFQMRLRMRFIWSWRENNAMKTMEVELKRWVQRTVFPIVG